MSYLISNTNIKKYIFGIVIIVGVALSQNINFTESQRYNKQCKDFGKSVVEENKDMFKGTEYGFFYSKRLDTCVAQSIDELGNYYSLCDIKRNYIKQGILDPTTCGGIFHCDKDGVDNVVLEKAEKYNGNLFDVTYKEFLDNGEGGEARALKTPDKPYTREKCKLMFEKKLSEIK